MGRQAFVAYFGCCSGRLVRRLHERRPSSIAKVELDFLPQGFVFAVLCSATIRGVITNRDHALCSAQLAKIVIYYNDDGSLEPTVPHSSSSFDPIKQIHR